MADRSEVIMELKADVGDAKKNLEQVKSSVEDIGKASKTTAKATTGIRDGIKGVGVALKAAGIGLALKAFEMLSEIFMKNQRTADFFNTAFEATSIAINDFVNFVFNNFGKVADFFKDVFENPVENLKALGNAIKDNLIERFNSAIEVAGLLGNTISLLVAGKFKEAAVTIKEAGKEMVDVVTGVDDSTTKIAETFTEVTEAVVDYTKETINSAKSNVELAKSAELANVQVQGLIEKYDREAEALRKIRDDETKTFAQRIEANEQLGIVLEKQRNEMLALRQIELDRAQVEYDKLQNQENLIALTEAQNELAAVNAQIEGFTSEQVQNRISLERELLDVKNELALEGISQRERELLEVEQHYDELFRLAEKSNTDITALEQQKADAISNIKAQQGQTDIEIMNTVLDNTRSVLGEESELAKGLAVLQATMNTYTAAAAALAPPPVGAGPLLGPLLAASTVALGLANVNKILSAPEPEFAQGGMVSGYGTGTSDSISARLSKGESVINARSTRMFKPLLSAINEAGGGRAFASGEGVGGATMGVVKAFVVADDMTKQQDKLSKIRRKATI
jgi:hypothetical protein